MSCFNGSQSLGNLWYCWKKNLWGKSFNFSVNRELFLSLSINQSPSQPFLVSSRNAPYQPCVTRLKRLRGRLLIKI